MAKNKRQPYAVSEKAGHQTSAESWGTGGSIFQQSEAVIRKRIPLACGLTHKILTWNYEQAVLSPVFLVSLEVVPIAPVKPPLATNAVRDACSRLPKSGANGIKRSISIRSELNNVNAPLLYCQLTIHICAQAFRNCFCPSSLFSSLASPSPRPSHLHRP